MVEKGTRVQISPELHEMIKEQYQILKSKGVKGISQLKVLEELCKAGLEYQKQKTQSGSGGVSEAFGILHPQSSRQEYLINSKSELKVMEQAILKREQRLLQRESHLDQREKFINEKYLTVLEQKEITIELNKDAYKSDTQSRIDNEKIKNRENTIDELKKERRELWKEIIILLKKIDKKTEKDPFFDYTLPFIAPAMMGFSLFKDNERDEAKSKLDPTLQKIIEMYSKGTKEEREKLGKDLLENLNKGLNKGDIGQITK
jgi:hypothetical protein